MAELVIAEKPSVARSIAEVIGAREKHEGYLARTAEDRNGLPEL